MKKLLLSLFSFSGFALAVSGFALSSCCERPPHLHPQDPDDVTGGPYEVSYKLYFDGATAPAADGVGEVTLGQASALYENPLKVTVHFSAWSDFGEREYVPYLTSGNGPNYIELKGTPGNYSVSGRNEQGQLSLQKEGVYSLHYYNADVSVSGRVVRGGGLATRMDYIPPTPDRYHDIELTIEASVNVAPEGVQPKIRNIRIEMVSTDRYGNF